MIHILVDNEKWKYKPSELSEVKTVLNRISHTYIDRNIKTKENAKITNRIIKNENITKQEALKAKKQWKQFITACTINKKQW